MENTWESYCGVGGRELDSISEQDLLDIVMGRAISQGERIIDEAKRNIQAARAKDLNGFIPDISS
jgi:hypothetical protein